MLATLDLKSVAIGLALAMFVVPFLLRLIASRSTRRA